MSGAREVTLGREVAFSRLIDQELGRAVLDEQMVGGHRRYVSELRRGEPGWSTSFGKEIRFASRYKVIVEANEPSELRFSQHIDDDAIVAGTTLTFESLDNNRTRIHYSVVPASGPQLGIYAKFIDSCGLAGALASLGGLDPTRSDALKAEEAAALDACTQAADVLARAK